MIFRILSIDFENFRYNSKIISWNTQKIIYSFIFYKEIEEIFEYGLEFISLERYKSIDYLFAVLQVTKNLLPELREQILYRTLISEFREEYFINNFDQIFISDLKLRIELDNLDYNYLSDNTSFSLDSYYYSD